MRHAGEDWTLGSGEGRIITLRDSPLEKAHHRGAITVRQYEAGRKFYNHWYNGGLNGLRSFDPGRVFGGGDGFSGMPASESQAFHRQRLRAAIQVVGKIATEVVWPVVCEEMPFEQLGYRLGWKNKPQAISAAVERLRVGLDALVVHWSL